MIPVGSGVGSSISCRGFPFSTTAQARMTAISRLDFGDGIDLEGDVTVAVSAIILFRFPIVGELEHWAVVLVARSGEEGEGELVFGVIIA